MRFDWITLKRRPTEVLPTAAEDHRGQMRVLSGDGATTADDLYFGRNNAGTLQWTKITDQSGGTTTGGIQARSLLTRLNQWLSVPASTSVTNYIGFDLGTSVLGTRTNDDANDGLWLKFETPTATVNDIAYLTFNIGSPIYKRSFEPDLTYRIKTGPVVTNLRYWCGMFSADPLLVALPINDDYAAFRYDTTADATAFWRCVSDDQPNATSSATVTTTGVAVTADTAYTLRIEMSTTEVRFWINETLVATHTTNIPALNTSMAPRLMVTNLNAAVHSFRASRCTLMHK